MRILVVVAQDFTISLPRPSHSHGAPLAEPDPVPVSGARSDDLDRLSLGVPDHADLEEAAPENRALSRATENPSNPVPAQDPVTFRRGDRELLDASRSRARLDAHVEEIALQAGEAITLRGTILAKR